jgi:hypothetical protein
MFIGIGIGGMIEDGLLVIGAYFAYQWLRGIWDAHPDLSQNKRLRDVPFWAAAVGLLLCTSPQWVGTLPNYAPWSYVHLAIFAVWLAYGVIALVHLRNLWKRLRGGASDESNPKK